MTRISKPMMSRQGTVGSPDLAYDYRRIIGARIREERHRAQLTQHELAVHLGIGETGISALELGRSSVSPERYADLGALFGLPSEEWGKFLLRYTDPWLYALIFGTKDKALKADLTAMAETPRAKRLRG